MELFVRRFFSEVDEPLSFQECLKMPRNFMDRFTALDSLPGRGWPSSQASLIPAIISLQEFASNLSACVPNI